MRHRPRSVVNYQCSGIIPRHDDAVEGNSHGSEATGAMRTGVTAALFVLALATGASAQTGMLKGKVVDAKDAPVEGAKVTITAKGMKSTREVKTNKKGEWVQIGLFPGEYSITAEKDGDAGTVGTRVVGGREPRGQDPGRQGGAVAGGLGQGRGPSEVVRRGRGAEQERRHGWLDRQVQRGHRAGPQLPRLLLQHRVCRTRRRRNGTRPKSAFKKATELKPDYAEAWGGLANAYNSQKKLDLRLKPAPTPPSTAAAAGGGGSASALYNQGVILWNQSKYAEAKEKFEAAAKADPSYSDAHYRLGMANLNLGDMPGAVAAFEGYLKAAPTGEYAEQVKGILSSIKK